jgi:hypothetical protein
MSGIPASSPKLRRSVLALGLCLLAFMFAMEAKLAVYSPHHGFGSDIRAAKALPEKIPALVPHGTLAPDPIHPLVPFASLFELAAGFTLAVNILLKLQSEQENLPAIPSSFFSPHGFFRPPPVL